MALLTSELTRCKYELGYNLLSAGAEPYIGVSAVFEQLISSYLLAGAKTTCATTVTAATTATPVTLTLTSATGFTAGDRVVVDVDDRYESAIVQALSGSTITLLLSLAHTGTYPVTVEGGEAVVRQILRHLYTIGAKLGDDVLIQAGISKVVDEVEFFGGLLGPRRDLEKLRGYWRNELASALGIPNLRGASNSGSAVAMY